MPNYITKFLIVIEVQTTSHIFAGFERLASLAASCLKTAQSVSYPHDEVNTAFTIL